MERKGGKSSEMIGNHPFFSKKSDIFNIDRGVIIKSNMVYCVHFVRLCSQRRVGTI